MVQYFHGNEPTKLREGHDLALVTHRTISQRSPARLPTHGSRRSCRKTPFSCTQGDAARLGLLQGQEVKVVSAINPTGIWDTGPKQQKPMIGLSGLRYDSYDQQLWSFFGYIAIPRLASRAQ